MAIFTVQMTDLECSACGMPFCISADFERRRREDGQKFFCPSGHHNVYTESELDRVRKQLAIKDREIENRIKQTEREKAAHDQTKTELRETERRRRAAKGVATRLKNRINAGTCPCCDQAFPDLHQHMTEAHPDFNAPEPEEEGDTAEKAAIEPPEPGKEAVNGA